ncbi:hypothetical protein V8F20_005865 [Naviculisporaceae sp. PSN 640]
MAAENGKKQVAADFQSFIDEGRERKKNEALAAKILGSNRRSSTPASKGLGGTMASRAGISKRSQQPRSSTGNVDGEWVHDLHGTNSPRSSPKPGSLAARISNPNLGPAGNPRQKRQAAKVAEALIRTELLPASARKSPAAAPTQTGSFNKGLTIRGLAGPFVVMAQNFAPGTTAADIESAMTPIGGIITRCQILKEHPIVIAEITFESKEGAENVIATFNNQTADGRILSVYPKAAGVSPAPTPAPVNKAPPTGPRHPMGHPPTGPRAQRNNNNDNIVDGTLGFADPMETDDVFPNGNGRQPPRGPKGLYSDGLVRGNGNRGGGRARGRGARR